MKGVEFLICKDENLSKKDTVEVLFGDETKQISEE